jgi:FAD dependent monooxygenase
VSQLYENLPDKSFVRMKKQVEHIEHTKQGVRVHLLDGTVEEGDMVIGADGVYSAVRAQMWKYANTCLPNPIPETDKSLLRSEYNAVFGVSESKDEYCLSQAETNVTYGHGVTKFLFTQPGVTYWLIVFKAKLKQASAHATTAQALEAIVHQFRDSDFTDKIKLSDLWAARKRATLVNLEEGTISQWHAGRIVVIGDAAHKVSQCQPRTAVLLQQQTNLHHTDDCRPRSRRQRRH